MSEEFGPFLLLRKIAEGGMAVTWLSRVRKDEPGRELVIKRILPTLSDDPDLRELFLEESRTAKLLDHDNLVRTWDFGQVEEEDYIAMEYVWGQDLRRIVERGESLGKPLPLRFAVHIIAKSARGLYFAHNVHDYEGRPIGLVHRDVSPPNIMATYDGAVKVVDFGIAKAESHYMKVRPGQLKGKYNYMSPEQVQGMEIDHRSDIFSLGILLYELSTRLRLFKADSDVETIKLISDCDFEKPSRIRADFPPRLEEIVLKSLAKNPDDRYQSAADLADALELFLAETRQQPTPAQLGGYMRELFPDDLEALAELAGGSYDGPTGKPRLPRKKKPKPKPKPPSEEEAAQKAAAQAILEDYAEIDEDFLNQAKAGNRIMMIIAGIVGVLLVFAAVMYFTGNLGNWVDQIQQGPHIEDFDIEADVERPDPPPTVEMTVNSEPEGAWVIVNGVAARAQTPTTVEVVQGATNTIMFAMEGYETEYENVEVGEVGGEISTTLVEITQPDDWEPPEPPEDAEETDEEVITEWTLPMGHIRVQTFDVDGTPLPGAEVLLNGELLTGETPVEFDVPAGQDQHITVRLAERRDVVTFLRAIPYTDETTMRVVNIEMPMSQGVENDLYTVLALYPTPQELTIMHDGEDKTGLSNLNLLTPTHNVIELTAPDHVPMTRAFSATVGRYQWYATLPQVVTGPSQLSLTIEPEGTTIFLEPLRHGSPGATEIGETSVEAFETAAGNYRVVLDRRADGEIHRGEFEIELEPTVHHTLSYRLVGEELELLESTTGELVEPEEEE